MGANRQTLRLRFIIKTMSAAVAHVPENLPGLSTFSNRDHLNTHRHCLLAFKAPNNLREIDHFGDIGIFSRYFSYLRCNVNGETLYGVAARRSQHTALSA